MKRLADLLAPLILIIALLGAWEAACRVLEVPAYFLPTPSAVATSLWADAPTLLTSAYNTLAMALAALVLASLSAQALALLVALSPILERAIKPLAVVLQVTPVVAIAPLVVIWAGIDNPERAIIALAALVAFFPIFSGAITGLKAADPDLERLFDLYGAGRVKRLVRLRLPSAVPFLLEGHKVAAGLALIGAVVAEFVAGSGGAQGLAWRILEAGNRLQTARMFAALVVLGLMGALLYAGLARLERSGLRWWRGR
ncbi:ABC transporter permease [Phenylobacterium sp.]|jgi:NitT/TauT family transport system permease protein|uniref:ABC transporter permease n=1 Tax=Phenylobacterium sp. TaxID=1871053 RepID=UPI000C8C3E93|nr:ABC transporter permease [Phenylobacterium sp.]MAK83797.1 ABC transporter permease [Phenylobacterium sp.]|tara:strand:- start:9390 stop:10157 length:768 start_codon:yes stop_codon:yes gene_type:complete